MSIDNIHPFFAFYIVNTISIVSSCFLYFLNLIRQVNLASQLVGYSCSKYSDIIFFILISQVNLAS